MSPAALLPLLALLVAPPLCPEAKDAGWLWAEDGTLQRRSAYRALPELHPRAREGIGATLRGLQARGVLVAVALVPDRGMVSPAISYDITRSDARYQELLAWLTEQGAVAPDLLRVARGLKDAPYFNTIDHHWTPEGARATAKALATPILARPVGARLATEPHITRADAEERWRAASAEQVEALCGVALPEEARMRYTTAPVNPPGLLDVRPPPPVVLVGTSFSQERFNFGGFLAEALSAEVLPIAVAGGAALGGLGTYLYSDPYQRQPPTILVWEIPVQNLLGLAAHDGAPDARDPLIYRELAAAARGDCAEPVLGVAGALTAGEQPILQELPAMPLDLALRLPPQSEAWTLVLRGEGHEERHEIAPYGRMPRGERLFWTLPTWTRQVSAVMPEGSSGAFSAHLCPRSSR